MTKLILPKKKLLTRRSLIVGAAALIASPAIIAPPSKAATWLPLARNIVDCDPFWSNVLLSVPFNGTDGSTTFTDVSTYGRTSGVTGNAQLDTDQSKFTTASLLTDGTTDNANFPASNDWLFSGQFTLEFWARIRNQSASGKGFLCHRGAGAGTASWQIAGAPSTGGSGSLSFSFSTSGVSDTGSIGITQAGLWQAATWQFIAMDRNSSNLCRLYMGTSGTAAVVASGTITGTAAGVSLPVTIGSQDAGAACFDGWICNVRVTTGVARYNGICPVPTAQFPVCQS